MFAMDLFVCQVTFATPVSIAAHPKINEWLTLVEKEMRVTLAKQLATGVQDMAAFKSGQIDQASYIEWADKFQVFHEWFCCTSCLSLSCFANTCRNTGHSCHSSNIKYVKKL